MPELISTRDFVKISDAARILGVTDQTLRNWDRAGRLVPRRHPINGYRMYSVADLHGILRELRSAVQVALDLTDSSGVAPSDIDSTIDKRPALDDLPPCHWSPEVALDPKHRPQSWNAPSTTVRRDWRKFPQEAHVLDATGTKYRRLTVEEIAILQGFDPSVARLESLTDRERIAALGDAVPPPVAESLVASISQVWTWKNRTALEICAGIGGLAHGAARAGLEHLLLVDHSPVCGALLTNSRPWKSDRVVVADLRSVDFGRFEDGVGLLSGGPPCQPWSQSGLHRGATDDRDLFGELPEIVATVRPEVLLFENVPGLASSLNREYLANVLARIREPARGLRYGVLVGTFNAADFGVPQIRERVFVLGFRDAPGALAHRCFDRVEEAQTHQRPDGIRRRALEWVTVGEALQHRPDPGGWRRWVTG